MDWSRTTIGTTLAAVLVVVAVAAPVAAATDKEIREAETYREGFGLESSPAVVEASFVDTDTYSDMSRGIPLTPAEAAEMDRRRDIVWAIGPAKDVARQRDGYSDMYIDQQDGGVPVFQFVDDLDAHRAAIEEVMPDGIDFRVEQAEFTIKQLRKKQDRLTADMLKTDWILDGDITLAGVGFDVVANRVLVGLVLESDEARAREILQDRYGPIVDVEFVGPTENDLVTDEIS